MFYELIPYPLMFYFQEVQYSVIGGEVDSLLSVHTQTTVES